MNKRSGFTLVELLVASLLMSIVMAGVYTLFYSTIGTWRAVDSGYDLPGRRAICPAWWSPTMAMSCARRDIFLKARATP